MKLVKNKETGDVYLINVQGKWALVRYSIGEGVPIEIIFVICESIIRHTVCCNSLYFQIILLLTSDHGHDRIPGGASLPSCWQHSAGPGQSYRGGCVLDTDRARQGCCSGGEGWWA